MQFTDAKKGISKVFWGAIFELISAVAAGISVSLFSVILMEQATDFISLLYTILSIGAFALALIGFIFNLAGLYQAGNDSKYLKDAFVLSIVGLIVALIGGIFAATEIYVMFVISQALSLFVDILEIGIVIYTCYGTANLLSDRNEEKLAASGYKTGKLFTISFALGAVISIVCCLFQNNAGRDTLLYMIIAILALVFIVLMVIAYIMYLVFLGKAKNNLTD